MRVRIPRINLAIGNKTNLVTSQFKPQLPCHLFDDFQADGGCVLLVVNGEEGDAPFMLGNDGILKLGMTLNFVAHLKTHLMVGICPTSLFPNTLSSPSWPGKSLPLRRAWVPLPPARLSQQAADGSCRGVNVKSHVRHDLPYPEIWPKCEFFSDFGQISND